MVIKSSVLQPDALDWQPFCLLAYSSLFLVPKQVCVKKNKKKKHQSWEAQKKIYLLPIKINSAAA